MTTAIDVVVVGRPHEVWPVACTSAAERAPAAASRVALVIAAGATGGVRLPELPAGRAARRLRDGLRGTDVGARAAGRLVRCRSAGSHVAELVTAASATGAAVVLAVCGPREDWCEPLIEGAGLVLVCGRPDDRLAALALAELGARGIDALAAPRPVEPAVALARLGVALPRRRGAA